VIQRFLRQFDIESGSLQAPGDPQRLVEVGASSLEAPSFATGDASSSQEVRVEEVQAKVPD
jgi:hypothetical protein